MKVRLLVASLATAGSLLLAAGCAAPSTSAPPAGSESAAPEGPKEIAVAIANEPRGLIVAADGSTEAQSLGRVVIERLVGLDQEYNPIPGLADSWERLSDTEWLFKLRDDVTFSNGEKFNAEVAVWNIKLGRNGIGEWTGSHILVDIADAEVVSEYEIKVTADPAIGFVPEVLTQVEVFAPEAFQATTLADWGRAPIGTGPFVFDNWVPGQEITFTRNPDYWGAPAQIDKLGIVWNAEADSRAAMLQTGQVQVAKNLPPQLIDGVEASGDKVVGVPATAVWNIEPNWHVPPFDNLKVRQALAHAIDREAIVQALFGGKGAQPYANLFNPLFDSAKQYPGMLKYDPEESRRLLAEVGDVIPVEFFWPTEQDQFGQAATAMLEEVGFVVNQHPMERGAYYEMLHKNDMPGIHVLGVNAGFKHESQLLDLTMFPHSAVTYCANPDLVEEADIAKTLDGQARIDAYSAIEEKIIVDMVCPIPVYVADVLWGISSKVDGFIPGPGGEFDFSTTVVKS